MTERVGREGQQFGNYRLLRLLGQGGFAEVYLSEHIYLGTQAAIKVLHTQLESEDEDHFRREARIIARLIHPHIVRVLDFGVEGSTPFLVVDFAPNGTLRKRYPKGNQLPLSTVVHYVFQLADALQYAHDQKVVHRDVKPENMLLGRNNELLLSDFGIALIVPSSQYQSTQNLQEIAGTVAYMAPEEIQYQASSASDQYALGVVVYEWLCGSRPFTGTFTEIAVKHALATPPPLREMLPELSEEVEAVVMKALAKDPKQRYASVRDFANALAQAAQMQPATTILLPNSSSGSTLSTPLVDDGMPIDVLAASKPSIPTPVFSHGRETSGLLPKTPPSEDDPGQTVAMPSTEKPIVLGPRRVSRREVVVALTGAGILGILAGGLSLVLHARSGALPAQGSPVVDTSKSLYIYRGHTDRVWSVVWSPDNKRIASASSDRTAQVWNALTGENPYLYSGHSDSVYAVAWSPNGQHIASASNDTTVQVWDATGGHPYTYTGHANYVWTVAWSPDSKHVASASGDKTVQVWDAGTRQRLFTYTGHSAPVYAVQWSHDGTRIASAGVDGSVQIWDALTGVPIHIYQSDASSIWSVAWSPDDKRIASAGDDNLVQVWNANNGDLPYSYHGHSDFVYSVTWSPDGKYIASGSDDKSVQVWSTANGDSVYTYSGHTSGVRSVVWSSNGKMLASGSWDKTVHVWQVGQK